MLTQKPKLPMMNISCLVHELGERIESYTKIRQGPREGFSVFLERLSRAVQLEVADIDSRQILIESAYENANPQCKQVLWPLKIQSAPLDEWV